MSIAFFMLTNSELIEKGLKSEAVIMLPKVKNTISIFLRNNPKYVFAPFKPLT